MSVMLRCACGEEVTVPEQAAEGMVACPKCHGLINPKTSVIHPRLDDLDPELMLSEPAVQEPAPELDEAAVEAARAKNAELDGLLSMIDLAPIEEKPHSEAELLSDALSSAQTSRAEDLGSSPLSAPTPSLSPSDDDEGYAVVESEISSPVESNDWLDEIETKADAVEEELGLADLDQPASGRAEKNRKDRSKSSIDDLLDDAIPLVSDEATMATPAKCPECGADLKPGTILCVGCGYNVRLGKKIESTLPANLPSAVATVATGTTLAVRGAGGAGLGAKFKDPRILVAAGGGVLAIVLGIVGFLFLRSEEPKPQSVATPSAPSPPPPGNAPTSVPSMPAGTSAPDSSAMALAPDASTAHPTLVATLTGLNGRITDLAVSKDGKFLVAGSESGEVVAWDLEKNEAQPPLNVGAQGRLKVAIDDTAKQILMGYNEASKLYDRESGRERIFNLDGTRLAEFSRGGQELILSGREALFNLVDLAAGGKTRTIDGKLPMEAYSAVQITADGKLAIVGGNDGLLELWDLSTGHVSKSFHGHTTRVSAVAISPDGKWILSAAGGPEYRTVDGERLLASSRSVDFTVRFWDVESGRERYRWQIPQGHFASDLEFSASGNESIVVAGEAWVVDFKSKKLIANLSSRLSGDAGAPGSFAPPSEPIQNACFSADASRVFVSSNSQGIFVWQLPASGKGSPWVGIADPIDLAEVKPQDWASIRPLQLTVANVQADEEVKSQAELVARAEDASSKKVNHLAAMKKRLGISERTPAVLLQLATLCQKAKLMLEAEECVRAVLMAEPTNEEAQKLYQQLKVAGTAESGPVSLARAWCKDMPTLDDAGVQPEPPRDTHYVSVPLDVAQDGQTVKLASETISAKAGDKEATFLGIYARPEGEVLGVKKDASPPSVSMQVWEAVTIGKEKKTGKSAALFFNRRSPQTEQPRGRQPSNGSPKIKFVSDNLKVREDYRGPYEAVFAVPNGESLSEIQWEDTPPVRILALEPSSIDSVAKNSGAEKSQRLAAIDALGSTPTAEAESTLNTVMAGGDDELFSAARAAMRKVRRAKNLIGPEFLPMPDAEHARLVALVLGSVDGQQMQQPTYAQYDAPANSQTAVQNYHFCKTLWNINQPGKYLARIAFFGKGPEFTKLSTLEFEFKATEPNLYMALLKVDQPVTPEVELVELWREGEFVERRFLSSNPAETSALAGRLPLEKPGATESPTENPGDGFGGGAYRGQSQPAVFSNQAEEIEAIPVFGAEFRKLPPGDRAALEDLVALLPNTDQSKLPSAWAEVVRLEMNDPGLTLRATETLRELLGDSVVKLFIRLAKESQPPTALAAIDSLHALGEKSAEACRTLVDLQTGPTDVQKAAQEAVDHLMRQGVIAKEGDNWRYHGETHFPEKTPDPQAASN